MNRTTACLGIGLLWLTTAAHAATFLFNTDPFAGTTALSTPGRQIVGGEPFISFNIATDVFAFDAGVFSIGQIDFASGLAANLPTTGVNVVVLQNSDAPFAAGLAANLIADRITDPGPGFFVYFNTGLDVPRLVYSTDLSDSTADLKVLARLINLDGAAGIAALPAFTAANFAIATAVPEPDSLLLVALGALAIGGAMRRTRCLACCIARPLRMR